MLALRQMIYTLARYRHAQPPTRVRVGGRLLIYENRYFLCDSVSQMELIGEARVFLGMNSGDQVIADIEQQTCLKLEFVTRGQASENRGARTVAEFSGFVTRVREFFTGAGLIEIFTPSLVACPGLEPSLEPFSTQVQRGREERTAYFPTSPEIHLKKALARDWTDIFEIKTCFRKGEFSAYHENEFFMLEWYRAFSDLAQIERDLRDLLLALGQTVQIERVSFAQLFREVLDFELTPATTREQLAQLCAAQQIHYIESDSFNDLFHRLLIDRLEPVLAARGPRIVYNFPPSQAALARLTHEGWADRFEFYWRGLEIANAFFEVTDPVEQAKRWQFEQLEREHLGTTRLPQDPGLIAALHKGLPPTGGIALGIERLFMAIHNVKDIRELRLFATEDLFSLYR